jgi:hypothetical protein
VKDKVPTSSNSAACSAKPLERAMPHSRLVAAAATYSLVLALSIMGLALVGLYWLQSEPPVNPPDNAPLRGLGLVMVFGAPMAFAVSLLVSVPFTYISWKRRPVSRPQIATLVGAAALAPVVPLAYVGMGMTFSPIATFLVACLGVLPISTVVFGLPAVAGRLERGVRQHRVAAPGVEHVQCLSAC